MTFRPLTPALRHAPTTTPSTVVRVVMGAWDESGIAVAR
jgi:hypothetical protein